MILEKDFEDIIAKYPELIEEGLTLKGRQISIYGRRMDLLFEDKFRRKLIVELKIGPIKDAHIGQILSYEGILLSNEDPTIRVMLIGNRVPPNIQRSLDYHGIAWREITLNSLKEFLRTKNDMEYLELFASTDLESLAITGGRKLENKVLKTSVKSEQDYKDEEELVFRIKSSEGYEHFREILPMKKRNEEKAKDILNKNLGKLEHSHIKEIIDLVDAPYPLLNKGKVNKGPWFARLLKSNTVYLYNESLETINKWFSILTNRSIDIQERLKLLLNEPNKIKGLNVGFITLILYILNKEDYLIWFEGQHDALKIFYPDLEQYTGSVKQYKVFNDQAKKFAKKHAFDHTEIDWVFSAGVKVLNEPLSTWVGLDQSRHGIEEIFREQKATYSVKRLAIRFYKGLVQQLNSKNHFWIARTHERGITFLCDDNKAFMWVNINQEFISVKFFSGNSTIEGLEKGTWSSKDDYLSTQPFKIYDDPSLNQALNFAFQAYEITNEWRKR